MLAVEVLMQAVVVAGSILKEKRRRPGLIGLMAALDEVGMLARITHIDAHRFIPAVGDRDQMRIHRRPELTQKMRERIPEVFVLSASETMPLHDDATAKNIIVRVETGDGLALLRGQKLFNHGVALLVQISRDLQPVEPINPVDCGCPAALQLGNSLDANHDSASFARSARFRSTPQR